MLANVIAATGGLPPETGNIETDYRELRRFLQKLLRVLERNTDTINDRLIRPEEGEV